MLQRVYPWKLIKDIEDIIIDRRTGPEYQSHPSRLFSSDAQNPTIGDPTCHASSVPPTSPLPPALGSNVPPQVVSVSSFEGAKDITLNNSLVNNVAGNFNPTIFKFDGSEGAVV
jgi:hypothetical protein